MTPSALLFTPYTIPVRNVEYTHAGMVTLSVLCFLVASAQVINTGPKNLDSSANDFEVREGRGVCT